MNLLPSSFVAPPSDGSIPPALAIDFHHRRNPHHVFAVLYRTADSLQIRVTFEQLARAVHRTAYMLNPGNTIPQGTNIGILVSISSLEYIVMILGAMRAGLVPFPISPRLNPSSISHLLITTQTSLLLIGGSEAINDSMAQIGANLTESNFSAEFIELPTLGDILSLTETSASKDQFKHFPSLGPMENNATVIILHSSGSTGMPKAIKYHLSGVIKNIVKHPHGWASSAMVGTMMLPTFHCLGVVIQVLEPLYVGYTQVLFAPASVPVIPTPNLTLKAVTHTNCTFMVCVPAFLEAWAHDEEAIAALKPMEGILFGGGPLTGVIGDKLANLDIKIYSGYGGTEFGAIHVAPPHNHNTSDWLWNYFKISPHVKANFIPQNDQENSFELVFEAGEGHHPFVLDSEINGKLAYRTRDLLAPHPSKANFWKFVGRADDRIVLLNGEKINPGPIGAEAEIVKCPIIQHAIVFGQARNQAGVLIELKEVTESLSAREMNHTPRALTKMIWPYIQRANRTAATHSRLDERAVVFVHPSRQLPRTPKGTILRPAALKLYVRDIEEMYAALEWDQSSDAMNETGPPESWTDIKTISTWVAERVERLLGRDIDETADLFQQGVDSLTATILRRDLKAALHASRNPSLQSHAQTLSQTVVFDHPTVRQLALFLVHCFMSPSLPNDRAPTLLGKIRAMIQKYDSSWSRQITGDAKQPKGSLLEHVVVTGTTGGLGSHLLAQLLASNTVQRVWALNRKSNGDVRDRQRASFQDKLLDLDLLASHKLTFVDATLDHPKLGLGDQLYEEIRSTATIIIHNAWQVNFNLSLQSFEPNIKGTRNLINLAFSSTASTGLPRFAFASSVSVAGFSGMGESLDEVSVRPEDAVTTTGYGQSKLVAEKLLESARQAGLQTCIVRIGQLTGDIESGSWDTTNWVPSIIASSVSVGCLPEAVGTVSWLPLDVAAQSMVDTCTTSEDEVPPVIHASHPRPVPWADIMSAFSVSLSLRVGCKLPIVELSEWNKRVAESAAAFEGPDTNRYKCFPSTMIQSMVDGITHADQQLRLRAADKGFESAGTMRLSTTRAEQMSESLRVIPRLGGEYVEKWVKYWEAEGLFSGPIEYLCRVQV